METRKPARILIGERMPIFLLEAAHVSSDHGLRVANFECARNGPPVGSIRATSVEREYAESTQYEQPRDRYRGVHKVNVRKRCA